MALTKLQNKTFHVLEGTFGIKVVPVVSVLQLPALYSALRCVSVEWGHGPSIQTTYNVIICDEKNYISDLQRKFKWYILIGTIEFLKGKKKKSMETGEENAWKKQV